MTIPKWLARVWLAAIILSSITYAQWTPSAAQQAGKGFIISGLFAVAVCVTALWALGERPAYRVYIIVWTAALFVADALSHLRPAAPLPPGQKEHLSTLGPLVTLALAGAIMVATWAYRRYEKNPRAGEK